MDAAARETGFGTGLLAHIEQREHPEEPTPPTAPPVDERASEAAEREARLAAREAAVEEALRRLEQREAALAAAVVVPPPAPAPVPARRDVSALLREHALREAERVWRAFDAALDATFPDGRPDVRTRLEAAETLVAHLELGGDDDPADELALRRDLRLAT